MLKFKKVLNSKILSLLVAGVFLLNSAAYGIDISSKPLLRPPISGNSGEGKERLEDGLAAFVRLNGAGEAIERTDISIVKKIIDFMLAGQNRNYILQNINHDIAAEKSRLKSEGLLLFLAEAMAPFIRERSRVHNRGLSGYLDLLKEGRDGAGPLDASWKECKYLERLFTSAFPPLNVTEGMTTLFRFYERWNLQKHLDYLILEKHRRRDYRISIKSIGCSRGNQPYSIAFVLHKKLEEHHDKIDSPPPSEWNIEIEAFDRNIPSLYAAKMGIYRSFYARRAMLTEEDFDKYFERVEGSEDLCRVREFIRRWIRPGYIDILDDSQLGVLNHNKSEIIFFTNVLIRNNESFPAPPELEKAIHDSFRQDYDHLFVSGNDSAVRGVILKAEGELRTEPSNSLSQSNELLTGEWRRQVRGKIEPVSTAQPSLEMFLFKIEGIDGFITEREKVSPTAFKEREIPENIKEAAKETLILFAQNPRLKELLKPTTQGSSIWMALYVSGVLTSCEMLEEGRIKESFKDYIYNMISAYAKMRGKINLIVEDGVWEAVEQGFITTEQIKRHGSKNLVAIIGHETSHLVMAGINTVFKDAFVKRQVGEFLSDLGALSVLELINVNSREYLNFIQGDIKRYDEGTEQKRKKAQGDPHYLPRKTLIEQILPLKLALGLEWAKVLAFLIDYLDSVEEIDAFQGFVDEALPYSHKFSSFGHDSLKNTRDDI